VSVALLYGCSDSAPRSEVITLVAVDDVQLVDPETVVGKPAQVIGTLSAGKSLPVADCRPRKSDIDVVVVVDSKPAVAWHGKYRLDRRVADPSKDPSSVVTRSCWGLLTGSQRP